MAGQHPRVLPSCQPYSPTPGPGLVGWSPTLRTPGLQMLVGWSRTLRTHIVYYTHNRFYTAALSLYVASTEAIAAFAVALALSAILLSLYVRVDIKMKYVGKCRVIFDHFYEVSTT